MAGVPGNQAYLAIAKQSGKITPPQGSGTPLLTPQFKNPLSGGNIAPTRATDRLSETDSVRDQGALFVTSAGIEGSPEVYCRPDSLGIYLGAVLGGIGAPSGTTPAITTVFTPAATLPYYTIWKMLGGLVYERFTDCVVGSITLAAEAGQPLTVATGIQGVTYKRLDATGDAAAITAANGVTMDADPVFSFNLADVMLNNNAGTLTAVKNVRSFELTIENNITGQQTDDVGLYDIAVGLREISLGFDMIFENIDEYTKFHTGTATGTALSPNVFTSAARFTFTYDANTSLVLDLPSIAYEEYPVDPDPSGAPVVVPVRAIAQRASGVPNLITATLKTNVTSYVTNGT